MMRDPTPLRFLTLEVFVRVGSPRFDMAEDEERSGGSIEREMRLCLEANGRSITSVAYKRTIQVLIRVP